MGGGKAGVPPCSVQVLLQNSYHCQEDVCIGAASRDPHPAPRSFFRGSRQHLWRRMGPVCTVPEVARQWRWLWWLVAGAFPWAATPFWPSRGMGSLGLHSGWWIPNPLSPGQALIEGLWEAGRERWVCQSGHQQEALWGHQKLVVRTPVRWSSKWWF